MLKENVLQTAQRFTVLAAGLKRESARRHCADALYDYRLGLFRIVVVGEIKKGKSSFINALLGETELLPALSDVATSTVFKIAYGERRRYQVFFRSRSAAETTPVQPLEITREQLVDYGTEDGNPDNQKGVDFIAIELPHPLLESGVVIIDTPGLGGVFRQHQAITWRYVPKADAIFFVLDSNEAVASRVEMDYLARLRQMTPFIFFIQTKTDLVEPEQARQWRERNLEIIAEALGVAQPNLLYFPLSAKLKAVADRRCSAKHLARSGFVPLLYFLHRKLLRAKEEKLAAVLLERLVVEAADMRRCLRDDIGVHEAKTREELDVLERAYADTKAKFERWHEGEYRKTVQAFRQRSVTLREKMQAELGEVLDESPDGLLIAPLLERVRRDDLDVAELSTAAAELQVGCVDRCIQRIYDIQHYYQQRMHKLLSLTAERLGQSCALDTGVPPAELSKLPAANLDVSIDGAAVARGAIYGGVAGGLMVGLAASLLFPPAGAAFFIAQFAGLVGGGLTARQTLEARRKEEALEKLHALLGATVQQARERALEQFLATAADYERHADTVFERAAVTTREELQKKLAGIVKARAITREENRKAAARLAWFERQVGRLQGEIRRLLASPAP